MARSRVIKIKNHPEAIQTLLMSQELTRALLEVSQPLVQKLSQVTGSNVTIEPEPGRIKRQTLKIEFDNYTLFDESQTGAIARTLT